MDSLSPSPLRSTSRDQLHNLCVALWGWEVCSNCGPGGFGCASGVCQWPRSKRLESFFDYYKIVTASYVPELLPGKSSALRNHADVLDVILHIKERPDVPRCELTDRYFSKRDGGRNLPPIIDQDRAFNLAVGILSMINCSTTNQSSGYLELGSEAIPWREDLTFIQFIEDAFPKTDQPSLNDNQTSYKSRNVKAGLAAKRLRRIAGLRFQATNDLRNHLRLDQEEGVLQIYHQTAFLKESLIATRSAPSNLSMGDSIKLGNIPRQLALEVLDSVQNILFPPDAESQSLLRSLVSRSSFDADCLRFESASHRRDDESEISYRYFGSRLMDLVDELDDPRPRTVVEKWFERRSGSRHVMMATLIGVIIAILLGLLGLAVGVFQAWVSYEAWKHPANSN